MSYFLSPDLLEAAGEVRLTGAEAAHLSASRRVRIGEAVELQDPAGRRFVCVVTASSRGVVHLEVQSEIPAPPEPRRPLALFVAASAEQALDLVVRQATELGATSVFVWNAERSPAQLTAPRFEQKRVRWERIAREAAKQSGRTQAPVVSLIADFEKLTAELQNFDHVLVADQGGTSGKPPSSGSVAVVVGPEGGFGEDEARGLDELEHVARVKLAGYTLRVETAVAAALALVSHPSNE